MQISIFLLISKKVYLIKFPVYQYLGDFKLCKELFNSAYFMVDFYIVLTFAVDNQ